MALSEAVSGNSARTYLVVVHVANLSSPQAMGFGKVQLGELNWFRTCRCSSALRRLSPEALEPLAVVTLTGTLPVQMQIFGLFAAVFLVVPEGDIDLEFSPLSLLWLRDQHLATIDFASNVPCRLCL